MRSRVLACGLLVCVSQAALAGSSVGWVSDYRYRGVSLTDGAPTLQGSLNWDGHHGAYAGVFASGTRIDGRDGAQIVSYLGKAWRRPDGSSWDLGLQFVALTSDHHDDYRELYVGYANDRWNARLHYQPSFLGDYGPATYAEFNRGWPIGDRAQVFAHVGWTWRGDAATEGPNRFDARIGIGTMLGAYSLQVQRVQNHGRSGYLEDALPDRAYRSGWVLGISRSW